MQKIKIIGGYPPSGRSLTGFQWILPDGAQAIAGLLVFGNAGQLVPVGQAFELARDCWSRPWQGLASE